jgi:hypothetical protein
MNTKLLDNKSASKSVTGARDKNKPVNDFLEITGIKKTNFRSMSPPTIQKEIDMFIGSGTAKLILWKS